MTTRLADLPWQARLDAWDALLLAWHAAPAWERTVAAAAASGLDPDEVREQLGHVVRRCRGDVLRALVERELGGRGQRDGPGRQAPRRTLVAAAATVPGLTVEAVAACVAVGTHPVVRIGRGEAVIQHMAASALEHGTSVCTLAAPDAFAWAEFDSAIVFGSDATVQAVRARLAPSVPVAAYGSRDGIAIVSASAAGPPSGWAAGLADDVLRFGQAGCMSPSWLFVDQSGDPARAGELVDGLRESLVRRAQARGDARSHHAMLPGTSAAAARVVLDAARLTTLPAGSDVTEVIAVGPALLRIVVVDGPEELGRAVATLGSRLQTAVIAADPVAEPAVARTVRVAGCTRCCRPGMAHLPDPLWPQDGIGRLAPLLGVELPSGGAAHRGLDQ